jgi:alcohol dehydrogenase class IV
MPSHPFDFATANRIIFGPGRLKEIGAIATEFGKRALIVTGSNINRAAPLQAFLDTAHISHQVFSVSGEPTIALARQGVDIARAYQADMIIGFGGGAPLDTGKAIAALITNDGDPLDYLEVIGLGKPLTTPPMPYIAIPTTAGTGAEVTRNAVLADPEKRVKVSLRSPLMLPKIALVDPELTYNLPPSLTASTGMDALAQVIEPFTCNTPNALVDIISQQGILLARSALLAAYQNSNNTEARQSMALVGLYGGMCLANAKLGAAHGFAAPIGGMFNAPHGAIVAALLPHVMRINIGALRMRGDTPYALDRYGQVATLLSGSPEPESAAQWVADLAEQLGICGLSEYGITEEDFPAIIEKAAKANSMKGNPVELSYAEMHEILTRSL